MTRQKSERFKIREMELEYELQMQREKMIGEFALTPPGIYLVGLGGSVVTAYIGALMTPEEDRDETQLDLLKKGLIYYIGAQLGPLGLTAAVLSDMFAADKNPLAGVFQLCGTGGAGLFTGLLILNEMKPDGSAGGGGVLQTLLGAV